MINGSINKDNQTVNFESYYGNLTVNKFTGEYEFNPNDAAIESLNGGGKTRHSQTVEIVDFRVVVSDGQLSTIGHFQVNLKSIGFTETNHNDNLIGNQKANSFDGLAGDDFINGNGGEDSIVGNIGDDILIGGEGNDVFKFLSILDSIPESNDIISDFQFGDKIDLSAIDAKTSTSFNDAFIFIGNQNFTADAQVRFDVNTHILSANVDDDFSNADFAIELTGVTHLSANDLIL
ncbi:MAG: hypothetical protein RL637_407 [Pseudomonadota bacterium]